MGKVLKKKIQGMGWWAKLSLIALLTLATMVFMYEGWYIPKQASAATVTYFMKADNNVTNIGIDSPTNLPAGAPSTTTTYPVKTIMGTTEHGTGARYYPAITNGVPVPAMASALLVAAKLAPAIRDYCRRTGQPIPETRGQVVRGIMETVADALRRQVSALSDRRLVFIYFAASGTQGD